MSWLLIGVLVFLVIMALIGAYNGFAKMLLSVASLVLALVISWVATPMITTTLIEKTGIEKAISGKIESGLMGNVTTEDELTVFLNEAPLPDGIRKTLKDAKDKVSGVEAQKEAVCNVVTDWIITVVVDIVLFIILWVVLTLLSQLMTNLIKTSFLKGIDKFLGIAIALAEGVLLVCVLLMVISTLQSTPFGHTLYE